MATTKKYSIRFTNALKDPITFRPTNQSAVKWDAFTLRPNNRKTVILGTGHYEFEWNAIIDRPRDQPDTIIGDFKASRTSEPGSALIKSLSPDLYFLQRYNKSYNGKFYKGVYLGAKDFPSNQPSSTIFYGKINKTGLTQGKSKSSDNVYFADQLKPSAYVSSEPIATAQYVTTTKNEFWLFNMQDFSSVNTNSSLSLVKSL